MSAPAHQSEDKLLEFAYGDLPRPEAEAVETHVRGCSKCAESLAGIKSVRATMSKLSVEPAPAAGLDSLLAYAEQTARRNAEAAHPKPWWSRFIYPMASVTALCLVGLVAWRAKDDFEVNPLATAAQAQRERVKDEGKLKEAPEAKGAPAQAAPPVAQVAPAPEPAPAAQPLDRAVGNAEQGRSQPVVAAPPPQPNAPAAKSEAWEQAKANDPKPAPEWRGKGGRYDGYVGGKQAQAPQKKEALPPDQDKFADLAKDAPAEAAQHAAGDARASESKRDVFSSGEAKKKSKPVTKQAPEKTLRSDFSNTAGLGAGVLNDGTSVSQAMEGNTTRGSLGSLGGVGSSGLGTGPGPLTKAPAPLGLSTGTPTGGGSLGSGAGGLLDSAPPKVGLSAGEVGAGHRGSTAPPPKPEARPSTSREQERQREEAPGAAPVQAAPPVATAAPAPPPRSSMTLKSLRGSGRGSSAADVAGSEDEVGANAAEAVVDQKKAADDADFSRRKNVSDLGGLISSAKKAQAAGDRTQSVKLALAVLDQRPVGAQRLEALSLACDGYEALGAPDLAAPFCDQLVREFPSTVAARQVVERQRAAALESSAKASRKASEAPERAAPVKAASPAAVDSAH